jgi:hypothetical protein
MRHTETPEAIADSCAPYIETAARHVNLARRTPEEAIDAAAEVAELLHAMRFRFAVTAPAAHADRRMGRRPPPVEEPDSTRS